MKWINKQIKKFIQPEGRPESIAFRAELISQLSKITSKKNLPVTRAEEGQVLFDIVRSKPACRCLEVGFATGSTAAFMLRAGGIVTSIDYAQEKDWGNMGRKLIAELGWSGGHELIEDNAVFALPAYLKAERSYDLVYIDCWKTFDIQCLLLYYASRLTAKGGMIVIDDYNMPSVRKAVNMGIVHYGLENISLANFGLGLRTKLWYWLTVGVGKAPFCVLRKSLDTADFPGVLSFDFYRKF